MKLKWLFDFHLTSRFFMLSGAIVVMFIAAYPLPQLLPVAKIVLILGIVVFLADRIILFLPTTELKAKRTAGKLFSLGDENPVTIEIRNHSAYRLGVQLYDEIPFQFQERKFGMRFHLKSGEKKILRYELRPLGRGEYNFGVVNAMSTTMIGLVTRRHLLAAPEMVPVFPSVIQMKKYELLAFASISNFSGIKKIRKIGHSYEFEQIKSYVIGDDVRSINWKATGRRNSLMVNQYEDERSQQVYTIIDKSRSMHMPFNGLSLLDYSINTSLVISNIALKKHDKAGLITYSHKIGSTIPAERTQLQLKKILQALYHEKPQPMEANYDLLYRAVKNVIHSRSLIFLYINFESSYAMQRALPVLQKINKTHLLVIMIFENTELGNYSRKRAKFISDIYAQTIAEKLILEKKQIVSKLRKNGIQTILSRPEDLSMNTVNKYLELKARGMI